MRWGRNRKPIAVNDSTDQPERCVVCGKDVTNVWFARLRRGEEWVKACSPACSIRYTDSLLPADGAGMPESNNGGHPLHFLVNGELWS
jgi:hypothetical protein